MTNGFNDVDIGMLKLFVLLYAYIRKWDRFTKWL